MWKLNNMKNKRINTILDYNNILVDIYNAEELKCLSDNDYVHFEQNIRSVEEQFNGLRQFLLNEYKIEGSKYYAPNYLEYFFFDAKSEEIISILDEALPAERQQAFTYLSTLDPIRTEAYRRLLK